MKKLFCLDPIGLGRRDEILDVNKRPARQIRFYYYSQVDLFVNVTEPLYLASLFFVKKVYFVHARKTLALRILQIISEPGFSLDEKN
jgi:hypothetical protein